MQNFEIIVVDDKKLLEEIGNIKFTIPRAGIEENNNFVSFSEEELQRKKTRILNRMPATMTEQDIVSWQGPIIDSDLCTDCKQCIKSCPVEALTSGVNMPEFNYKECINCLCCIEMCPQKAVSLEKSLLADWLRVEMTKKIRLKVDNYKICEEY